MAYVDGYVLAVKTARKDEYAALARQAGEVFREHGATSVIECWGDDVPEGERTSFPMAVAREPDETVVFSWIVWPSKEARDEGNRKVSQDARMQGPSDMTVMDPKRMIYGGFTPIVELGRIA